jgi:hypothetical protein
MRYVKLLPIQVLKYQSQSAHMAYSGYQRPSTGPTHRTRSSNRFCRQDYLLAGRYIALRIAY